MNNLIIFTIFLIINNNKFLNRSRKVMETLNNSRRQMFKARRSKIDKITKFLSNNKSSKFQFRQMIISKSINKIFCIDYQIDRKEIYNFYRTNRKINNNQKHSPLFNKNNSNNLPNWSHRIMEQINNTKKSMNRKRKRKIKKRNKILSRNKFNLVKARQI